MQDRDYTLDAKSGLFTRRNFIRSASATALGLAAARYGLAAALTGGPIANRVRFAVLGDFGDGGGAQRAIGDLMASAHDTRALDLILTAGDNIYPNGEAEDFGPKFEEPFEAIIKRRVPFHACLGNHDIRQGTEAQLRYPLFNMNGRNYYTTSVGDGLVEFFVLDSNDLDDRQIAWLDRAMGQSTATWKIPIFHHPIYSSGKKHGSSLSRRKMLEPVFTRHRVAVAFSGHDHIYQRVVPQNGIQYFVTGGGGKIRRGGIDYRDKLVAKGFDEDSHFMLIDADSLSLRFTAVSATGATVDSGEITQAAAAAAR